MCLGGENRKMAVAKFERMGPTRNIARRERLLVVFGSALVGCIAILGFLLFYSNHSIDAKVNVVGDPVVDHARILDTVELIAPAEPVTKGSRLSQVTLVGVDWQRDKVPEGAIRDIEQAKALYAKVDLPANQPLTKANLQEQPISAGGLGDLLPQGYRAMTIEVDATSSVEGWAQVGASVDVLLTYLDKKDGENKTRIIAQKATVISYDGRMTNTQSQDVESAKPVSTVTLSVSTQDMLAITTARSMGRLTLVLRNPEDTSSPAVGEFAQGDFDSNKRKKQTPAIEQQAAEKGGFAKYTDSHGNVVEKQFDKDRREWFRTNPDMAGSKYAD